MDALIIKENDESVLYCVASIICNLKFIRSIFILEEKREVGFWKKIGQLVPKNRTAINIISHDDLCYANMSKNLVLFYGNTVVLNPLNENFFVRDSRIVSFVKSVQLCRFLLWKRTNSKPIGIPIVVDKHLVKTQCQSGLYEGILEEQYQNARLNPEEFVINSDEKLITLSPSDDSDLWQTIETAEKTKTNFCRIKDLSSFQKDQKRAVNDWIAGKIKAQILTCSENAG